MRIVARPYTTFFGRLFGALMFHFGPYRPRPETADGSEPRTLPLLTHLDSLDPADWLRTSLATFGRNVSSFVPGDFPRYARVYHPFDGNGGFSTWREQLAVAGELEALDPAEAEDFAYHGVPDAQARVGTLPLSIIRTLLEHLGPATTTPEECYFAIWEGCGSAVPPTLMPKLELPGRAYHVFTGPLAAALTSFDDMQFEFPHWPHHMSANLWWPADHAWFVASEIDFAWTYVGASGECIDAVLKDPRIEAVETSAHARW
jgi:hypothetical protein